jgi:pimeloyl-ACP methyl ester carboxylesterase
MYDMILIKRFVFVLIVPVLVLAGVQAQAGDVSLDHAGLQLNASWQPAGEDWQAGPVLLMTHGTLAHGRMEIMATLQELFADAGLSSLSITLSLGQSDRNGMYDCATLHTHRHTDALDEIGVWLQWLKEQGAAQVVLLGHSRGGNQTAWFAVERDDPVIQKVVLIAPMTWDEQASTASYEKLYGEPVSKLLARAQAQVDAGKGSAGVKTRGFIYCADATATADAVLSYYTPEPRMDTPSLIPKISKPVLVIAATEDEAVPGLPDSLAPLAEQGGIELVVIDGADHFFRDLYADEVVEAIQAFVEQ